MRISQVVSDPLVESGAPTIGPKDHVGRAVQFAEHRGRADVRAMVAQAWDLEVIEAAYEAFLADFAGRSPNDPLTATVELVHAWRRFPWIDPALPSVLLPGRWSGTRAAELFRRRHDSWVVAARAEWTSLNEMAA